MGPTEQLIGDHKAVIIALQILERVAAALDVRNEQATEHFGQLLEFLKVFVDRCHHGQEEEVLFPELEEHGVQREGGLIGVMLMEHNIGRGHIRAMSEGLVRLQRGEASAVTAIRQSADAYGELLRMHIHKENSVLFPIVDQLIVDGVAATMVRNFEAIERECVGEGKREAYHALLHNLRGLYGLHEPRKR